MSVAVTMVLIIIADFLITWGILHAALELLQYVGMPWEPTALATAVGAVAFKLFKAIL